MDKIDIEQLVSEAKKGDKTSFSKIYQHFADSVYRYALLKTKSQAVAEDITAETFKKVWSYLSSYQSNNFKAYLYTIARNVTIDYFKKEQREKISHFDDIDWISEETTTPTNKIIKQQQIKKLHQAIDQLSDSYREIILLRCIEELSVKETAKITGRSRVSVRVTQHRAIKKLKEIMSKKKK